jgi:alkylation response protein AidB-like acyl-CoA dehydrogenase
VIWRRYTYSRIVCLAILHGGNEFQKKNISRSIEAELKPYTAAILEPRFDFDPNSLAVEAVSNQEGYILSGEKVFVPFAAEAREMIVYANLNGNTQGFIVPIDRKGVKVEGRQPLMGMAALNWSGVLRAGNRPARCSDGHDF